MSVIISKEFKFEKQALRFLQDNGVKAKALYKTGPFRDPASGKIVQRWVLQYWGEPHAEEA